jgi:hypothetical protein
MRAWVACDAGLHASDVTLRLHTLPGDQPVPAAATCHHVRR